MTDLLSGLAYTVGGTALVAGVFVGIILFWNGIKIAFQELSTTRPWWPMEGPPVL